VLGSWWASENNCWVFYFLFLSKKANFNRKFSETKKLRKKHCLLWRFSYKNYLGFSFLVCYIKYVVALKIRETVWDANVRRCALVWRWRGFSTETARINILWPFSNCQLSLNSKCEVLSLSCPSELYMYYL
jgi:hypothetical protein